MTAETRWVRITQCENIPLHEGRAVRLGRREIAVFNLGDRFLAVENRCPHRGGPLSDGIVSGESVVCPLHGWKIDLAKGNVQRPSGMPVCVRTVAVRVEEGTLLLEMTSKVSVEHAGQLACEDRIHMGEAVSMPIEGVRA